VNTCVDEPQFNLLLPYAFSKVPLSFVHLYLGAKILYLKFNLI
jgi:hypothetical protein